MYLGSLLLEFGKTGLSRFVGLDSMGEPDMGSSSKPPWRRLREILSDSLRGNRNQNRKNKHTLNVLIIIIHYIITTQATRKFSIFHSSFDIIKALVQIMTLKWT